MSNGLRGRSASGKIPGLGISHTSARKTPGPGNEGKRGKIERRKKATQARRRKAKL